MLQSNYVVLKPTRKTTELCRTNYQGLIYLESKTRIHLRCGNAFNQKRLFVWRQNAKMRPNPRALKPGIIFGFVKDRPEMILLGGVYVVCMVALGFKVKEQKKHTILENHKYRWKYTVVRDTDPKITEKTAHCYN